MSPLLAGLLCLLASTAGPIDPYTVGSGLPGGYRIEAMERTGEGAFVVTLEGDPPARVLFFRREDDVPAFTRTASCNVVYDSSLPPGSPTPQDLGRAVQALADAADEDLCRELSSTAHARAHMESLERDPPFPWAATALALLAFCLLGLASGRASRALSEAWKERIFWAAVLLVTAAGAALRLPDISLPFCESSFTQRVELAERSFWQLLTYQVFDGRHPPLTALLLHLTLPLGRSEAAVRLPFVIAASLSLPLVALLGRRIESRVAGLAACLACALLQPLVYLGHQASSHALLFMLAPCVLLALHRMLEKPGPGACLALAAANAAVLWTNYLAAFLVGPQLVLLAWRSSRAWTGRALGLSAALALLPLYRMVRGLQQDAAGRAVSERAPEVVWGDVSVGRVLADCVEMMGVPVAVTLAALAVAGTVLLVRRARGADRGLPVVLAAAAWLGPIVVLALTPVARMKGQYMYDLAPLLVLLAVLGAAIGARMLASRWPAAVHAATWGAAFLPAILAAGPAFQSGPGALAYRGQECPYDEAAQVIARSDVPTIVVPFGHSRTLFGYYLGGHGEQIEDRTGLESWRYGSRTVRALILQRDLQESWREDAERKLSTLTSKQRLWLVDVTLVEHTWPGLEKAGRCREQAAWEGLRLLLCPGLSAPAEPSGP